MKDWDKRSFYGACYFSGMALGSLLFVSSLPLSITLFFAGIAGGAVSGIISTDKVMNYRVRKHIIVNKLDQHLEAKKSLKVNNPNKTDYYEEKYGNWKI